MRLVPAHYLPDEKDAADALFHYTTAEGLIGIIQSGQLWSTAYYCTNDESELAAGEGLLTPTFKGVTHQLDQERSQLTETFRARGVHPMTYADGFEQRLIAFALHELCAYITCFFRPTGKEDFVHGLLSQWRAYGRDGGYAIQFSRKKLLAAMEKTVAPRGSQYDLKDVRYGADNDLKAAVLEHKQAFIKSYMEHLEEIAEPLSSDRVVKSPIVNLLGGPLESLLDYLVHTKSIHFAEERECRLSSVALVNRPDFQTTNPTYHFSRDGLVVPYKRTSRDAFPILDSIEWILIGPNPQMADRFRSVSDMVHSLGLPIKVRASAIPFRR